MDHKQLADRIKTLEVSTIKKMSPDGLATLTDKFKEPLVKEIMYRATTNSQQRELFKVVKAAYKHWMTENEPLWGRPFVERYPEFMNSLQLDIECGMKVTKDGAVPEPASDMVPAETIMPIFNSISSAFGQSICMTNNHANNASNQRIRSLEQKVREMEAKLAKAGAKLKKRTDDNVEVSRLKAVIEQLQIDLDGKQKEIKAMPAHQAAILVTAVLRELKQVPQKREDLSPVLTKMWGFTDSTAKKALRRAFTQEEADDLAKQFTYPIPKIAKLIRKLPKELETEKNERLKELNKKS